MSIISVQLKYLVRKTSARPSRNDWVPSDVRRLTVHNWGNFFLSQSPSYSINVKDCSGGRFVIISDLFNKKRVFGAKWSLTSSGSLSWALPGEDITSGRDRTQRDRSASLTLRKILR
jgi:hypothetical protein